MSITIVENNYFNVKFSTVHFTNPRIYTVTSEEGTRHMNGYNIFELFIKHGLEIDEHFAQYEKEYNSILMGRAIHRGDLEVIKQMYDENNFNRELFNLVEIAIGNNQLDIVKYLVEEKKEPVPPENLSRLCKEEFVEMSNYLESRCGQILPKS
jgi:hypothetical protein